MSLTAISSASDAPINLSVPDRAERPEEANELRRDYVATVRAGIDVLNARLLALLALIGALAMWSWCVVDPVTWRFIACCGYSVLIMGPTILLHWKRG